MSAKVPMAEKLVFSGGLLGQNMLYSFMSMYILFFYTDLLGIPATTASVILVAASIIDACLDPLMGMITDKTRSRWGKFRPYLLFAPCLIALATVLCFWDFGGSRTVTLVIATVSYLLWGMLYTVCDTPLWALSSVVSTDPGNAPYSSHWAKSAGRSARSLSPSAVSSFCSPSAVNGIHRLTSTRQSLSGSSRRCRFS